MLAGRTAAEIAARDDDAARFALFLEIAVQILHAVGGQLGVIGRVEVAGGDDDVSIHVVAIFKYTSICFHIFFTIPF